MQFVDEQGRHLRPSEVWARGGTFGQGPLFSSDTSTSNSKNNVVYGSKNARASTANSDPYGTPSPETSSGELFTPNDYSTPASPDMSSMNRSSVFARDGPSLSFQMPDRQDKTPVLPPGATSGSTPKKGHTRSASLDTLTKETLAEAKTPKKRFFAFGRGNKENPEGISKDMEATPEGLPKKKERSRSFGSVGAKRSKVFGRSSESSNLQGQGRQIPAGLRPTAREDEEWIVLSQSAAASKSSLSSKSSEGVQPENRGRQVPSTSKKEAALPILSPRTPPPIRQVAARTPEAKSASRKPSGSPQPINPSASGFPTSPPFYGRSQPSSATMSPVRSPQHTTRMSAGPQAHYGVINGYQQSGHPYNPMQQYPQPNYGMYHGISAHSSAPPPISKQSRSTSHPAMDSQAQRDIFRQQTRPAPTPLSPPSSKPLRPHVQIPSAQVAKSRISVGHPGLASQANVIRPASVSPQKAKSTVPLHKEDKDPPRTNGSSGLLRDRHARATPALSPGAMERITAISRTPSPNATSPLPSDKAPQPVDTVEEHPQLARSDAQSLEEQETASKEQDRSLNPKFEQALTQLPHDIFVNILHHLDYSSFRSLRLVSSTLWHTFSTPDFAELVLERYLGGIGYRRIALPHIDTDFLQISLKDLDAFQAGLEYSLSEYAIFSAEHKRQALDIKTQRMIRASTRAHNKLVVRIRSQPSGLKMAYPAWLNSSTIKTPIYRSGRAAVLRVWIPTANTWMSDNELLECERECHRSGVWKQLERGDLIRNIAVSDIANEGMTIFDGRYLRDLDYQHDTIGHLPSWLNALSLSPGYFHNQIASSTPQPVFYIDITPFAQALQQGLILCKERADIESPSGDRYKVNRYVYRTIVDLKEGTILGDTQGRTKGSGPGGIEVLHSDWAGQLVIEVEGTSEAANALLKRAVPQVHSMKQSGNQQVTNNTPFRVIRSLSRPGQIWLKPVVTEQQSARQR